MCHPGNVKFSHESRGRFGIKSYEQPEIFRGIHGDLTNPVGQSFKWMVFDRACTERDSIYAVASSTGGRKWKRAITIPAFHVSHMQGTSHHTDRGMFNADFIRVSVAADRMTRLIPDFVLDPDAHLGDRISFWGKLFVPHTVYLRGILRDSHTVITIEGLEVTPDESVNDHQMTDDERPYQVIGSQDDEFTADHAYRIREQEDSLQYPYPAG